MLPCGTPISWSNTSKSYRLFQREVTAADASVQLSGVLRDGVSEPSAVISDRTESPLLPPTQQHSAANSDMHRSVLVVQFCVCTMLCNVQVNLYKTGGGSPTLPDIGQIDIRVVETFHHQFFHLPTTTTMLLS